MRRRTLVILAASATALAVIGCSLISGPPALTAQALTAASNPPRRLVLPAPKAGRTRPLIAVVADNAGTETTDFIIPYGVLKQAGVADVVTVATGPGWVELMPALKVQADTTLEAFDATTPAGADIVIVPALHNAEHEGLRRWLQAQRAKGTTIVAICEGAWVVAGAGLLTGKAATTHWYAMDDIASAYPDVGWIRGRRYVPEDGIMTTTGVSASIPASLALIEAIAGTTAAQTAAARLGVSQWGPAYPAEAFRLTAGHAATAAVNWLSWWNHETVAIPVGDGVDEVALALTADAWSRTFASQAIAVDEAAIDGGAVRSRNGLLIETAPAPSPDTLHVALVLGPSAAALDEALDLIGRRFGTRTAGFVALQLEYPSRRP